VACASCRAALRLRLERSAATPATSALREAVRLRALEAITAATRQGGELMMRGGELGQVRPGFLADLLLVDGDPSRDVSILQHRERLLAIMQDGRFRKRPAASRAMVQPLAAE
jgi:imidazolonepropionase-like amidohydrolase